MAIFARTIGIDYSGAQTPTVSLKGLRVYLAAGDGPPAEVHPLPSPRKYWTRKGVAHWLVERLAEDTPTLVGIDHGFSFPVATISRFTGWSPSWPAFLDDFLHHWPTDEDHTYVDFVRDGSAGNGVRRGPAKCPLAAADRRTSRRRQVGISFRRAGSGGQIHPCRDSLAALHPPANSATRCTFWPFDGWDIPHRAVRHCLEVYPALWSPGFRSRGPHRRSARRLLHCRLAVARQQGRQRHRVSRSEPDTARAQCGKRGRVDSRGGVATARFVILVKGLGRRPPLGCPGERPSWSRNVPPPRATGRRQDGRNVLSSTDWCDREADRRSPG